MIGAAKPERTARRRGDSRIPWARRRSGGRAPSIERELEQLLQRHCGPGSGGAPPGALPECCARRCDVPREQHFTTPEVAPREGEERQRIVAADERRGALAIAGRGGNAGQPGNGLVPDAVWQICGKTAVSAPASVSSLDRETPA